MFLKLRPILSVFKRNVTALYIPGNKAKDNIAVVMPHMEFVKRLGDRKQLQQNIARRKVTDLNLEDIFAQWDFFETLQLKKQAIEKRRKEVSKLTLESMRLEDSSEKENLLRKYKNEGEVLREDLRALRNHSYSVEEQFINDFLAIPNDLHTDTPDEVKEFFKFQDIPENSSSCDIHLEYEEFVDYYDETAFYLKKAAAKFDLKFPFYCTDRFRNNNGFKLFSNPDFAKTAVVEGAGVPVNELFLVGNEGDEKCTNLIHLVGNGSMLSFLGFITKLSVPLPMMPLGWVCTGKQYQPSKPNDLGLYDVCQSTAVQMFSAGLEQQVHEIFRDILKQIIELYKQFNLHFRVVYVPAYELKAAECLKMRIEMYSPHLKRYIEVGNLSNYSDYISKRLLFNYSQDNKTRFPHVISGTVCNVTKLIAIILENNNGSFNIPKSLENI